jgi:hypothetical protein
VSLQDKGPKRKNSAKQGNGDRARATEGWTDMRLLRSEPTLHSHHPCHSTNLGPLAQGNQLFSYEMSHCVPRKPLLPLSGGNDSFLVGCSTLPRSQVLPTLLSLALMQTWPWLYSLLNVCVRRRKHCGQSICTVRMLYWQGPGLPLQPRQTEPGLSIVGQ